MLTVTANENIVELVEKLNFAEKVERSLDLIDQAYKQFGDSLVVANSLGKDSVAVWHLAKQVSPKIRGFCSKWLFRLLLDKKSLYDGRRAIFICRPVS